MPKDSVASVLARAGVDKKAFYEEAEHATFDAVYENKIAVKSSYKMAKYYTKKLADAAIAHKHNVETKEMLKDRVKAARKVLKKRILKAGQTIYTVPTAKDLKKVTLPVKAAGG